MEIGKKYIGKNGVASARARGKEVLVLGTYICLTKPYWQSRVGDCSDPQKASLLEFLKGATVEQGTFSKP